MARVASLLNEMRARIRSDGKVEQMSYDKYACWCEEVLSRKAKDIAEAEKQSKALQTQITKLFGEIGAHNAEIKSLEGDIAANLESQRDARSVRDQQNMDYEGKKTESEQCIGALESAIKVLTAGTRGGFLETMKEVELLSVVSGVRGALKRPSISKSLSSSDLTLVNSFIEHPSEFVGKRAGNMMNAMQIANNPFGDYAPQSTQIQGILRGMYEAFTRDLESDNAAEGESQKNYEELMNTKRMELATLQATLGQQQADTSRKSLERDLSSESLDETKAQLAADEKFFDTTKAGCKVKARQWSIRSGLRTEELTGVTTAINILTSPEASKVFHNSTTTFVQVKSVTHNSGELRLGATNMLSRLAQRFNNFGIAELAVQVQSGGHFDKVIAAIDKMIAALRKEEQEDIDHRDRCQRAEDKNANDITDLGSHISKAETSINSLNADASKLQKDINNLKLQILKSQGDMKTALDLRNDAVADSKQALKDDVEAIALLDRTIVALSRFYKNNRISMSLVQNSPNYTVDPDKAPETTWANENYGGRSEETHGIVEIIRMIREDIEKEIKTSREDDAASQAQYEKERAELQDGLDSQMARKNTAERELGEVEQATRDKTKFKTAKGKDLQAEQELEQAIDKDCAWVASHFESRRTKRKAEIDGLIDAKGYLAGAEEGSLI